MTTDPAGGCSLPVDATSTSTSLFPPDWSSFIPDTLGAVFTGLAVGAVIVLYERWLDKQRGARQITSAQLHAVDEMGDGLAFPFAYDSRTLQPDGTQIERAVKLVQKVPQGKPAVVTPGFTMLRALIDQYGRIPSTAMDLRHALEARLRNPPHVLTAMYLVNKTPDLETLTSSPVAPPVAHDVFEDPDVLNALQRYLENRTLLNAAREAFIAADGVWRSKSWVSVLEETKGAPHPRLKKAWRARAARKRMAAARVEAEEAGMKVMQDAGPVWFPPRAW